MVPVSWWGSWSDCTRQRFPPMEQSLNPSRKQLVTPIGTTIVPMNICLLEFAGLQVGKAIDVSSCPLPPKACIAPSRAAG